MKIKSILMAACVALTAGQAAAQDPAYPTKPITIVVPFAAGGTVDIIARMVGEHLQKKLGTTVVVENMGGAGGNIGVNRVAKAAPDGYTIGLASTSPLAIAPTLYGSKLQFQPEKDLVAFTQVSIVPNVLVVNPDRIKARTVRS